MSRAGQVYGPNELTAAVAEDRHPRIAFLEPDEEVVTGLQRACVGGFFDTELAKTSDTCRTGALVRDFEIVQV